MTTLNTIIEEEKKEFDENWQLDAPDETTSINENIKDFIVTAMQRAYEAGQSEERAKIREEMDKCESCAFNPCEKHKLLTPTKTDKQTDV